MKTSYELAMERLGKSSPSAKLTAAQKRELADIDSLYKSKIAEREIALRGDIEKAVFAGEEAVVEELRNRLNSERAKLEAECEAKKDRVRGAR